ncbi:MAG TPA: copper resistance system multicopper oxidase [Steroidobacteraceae bacterium]|nr:copper resistance system multicopper oxidase [Steroidobacteraceae bacterium]
MGRREHFNLDRRKFLHGAAVLGGGATLGALLPSWAASIAQGMRPTMPTLSGNEIKLVIGHTPVAIEGRTTHAVTINGTVPGPLLRLKEGERVKIAVTNTLGEDTSIHWHGLLVPPQMDGVPGVSFPGIRGGETFVYEFPLLQSGTYWYHSHSGLQEAEGHYAPLIIEPANADPVQSDREHVIVLADHSGMHPHLVFKRLKQQGGAFNYQRQTIAGLLAGEDQSFAERAEWARMLMDPTDISDVTGAVMTFLVNGHGPNDNWTGLFRPGERVRLRFINAAAQMIFNVRVPGLKLSVVAADGQNVRPVEVDEFQIGNAETYDVVVRPTEDRAYTLVAEAVDRSGMGRATLAPRPGMTADVPPLRKRPLATMKDMGMDMSGHAHGAGSHEMSMDMRDASNAPQVRMGPGVQMIAPMPMDRTGDTGQGLEHAGHRVLVYTDLVALERNPDMRVPSRALEIRLTGNMERFTWGFDGWKYSDGPPPYSFRTGERVRITLVNDTMMTHPIHLHGHFFELVHGPVGHRPRKHTVNVLPGGKVSYDLTAEEGDWAFHCHMLYHMHGGMFQVFKARAAEGNAT